MKKSELKVIPQWRIELFGTLRARGIETTVTRFRTRRIALLLGQLAVSPGIPVSRDVLGERIWPEEDPVRQRGKIRYSLSMLRRDLGVAAIQTTGHETVALHSAITSDLSEFRESLRAAATTDDPATRAAFLQRAVAVASQPLLDGFYDDWVIQARESVEESLFSEALLPLLGFYEIEGRSAEASALRRNIALRFPERPIPTTWLPSEPGHRALFGRDEERRVLRTWAVQTDDFPVLTVTGIGGIGKTRLVREALGDRAQAFVSLAGLSTAPACYGAIRAALALPHRFGRTDLDRICDALGVLGAPLLILDNAELAAPILGPAIELILDRIPGLRIAVTSRLRLGSDREREVRLGVLDREAARQLFLARARRFQPDFALVPEEAATIEAICQLLEGLPLSIEIAAARALHLGPEEIRQQLSDRLRFLTTHARPGESSERRLRAVLEWSYERLSQDGQRAFRELSVFCGGLSGQAARSVCGDTPPVLDLLEELVVYGLLQARPGANETRYHMLAVVEELALSLLDSSSRNTIEDRHLDYFYVLAKGLGERAGGGEWSALTSDLLRDRDNLARAIAVAVERGNGAVLRGFVASLGAIYLEVGLWEEMDVLLSAAESVIDPETTPDGFALVRTYRAVLCRRRGDGPQALTAWESLLAHFERRGERLAAARTRMELMGQHIDEGRLSLAADLLTRFEDAPGATSEDALKLATVRARLAYALNEERASTLADDAYAMLEEETPTVGPRSWLVAAQYLSPIYRDAQRWEPHSYLVEGGISRAWDCRQTFTLGVLLMEKAHLAARRNAPLEQVKALHAAHQIHRSLASRLLRESAERLHKALEAVGDHPEVATWLESAPRANELPILTALTDS